MLSAALEYAARGWPVFPCRESGERAKAPYLPGESTAGARDGGHWLASSDAGTIRDWWGRWPAALIGMPTGCRSGLVVIDLDPKAIAADAMLAALADWCGDLCEITQDGEVLEPWLARTQSGGLHLAFRYPSAAALAWCDELQQKAGRAGMGVLGNRTGLFRQAIKSGHAPEVLEHVDVRGEGGYIIAAPSRMANGRSYEWLSQGAGTTRLPALPAPLLARIMGLDLRPEPGNAGPARPAYQSRIDDERVRRYVERTVRGVLNAAASAAEGSRNACVFWAACRLGEFVLGGQLSRSEAESLLLAHLPAGVSAGEKKIRDTIRNGLENKELTPFSPEQLRARRAA